jgi:hypothetical protein
MGCSYTKSPPPDRPRSAVVPRVSAQGCIWLEPYSASSPNSGSSFSFSPLSLSCRPALPPQTLPTMQSVACEPGGPYEWPRCGSALIAVNWVPCWLRRPSPVCIGSPEIDHVLWRSSRSEERDRRSLCLVRKVRVGLSVSTYRPMHRRGVGLARKCDFDQRPYPQGRLCYIAPRGARLTRDGDRRSGGAPPAQPSLDEAFQRALTPVISATRLPSRQHTEQGQRRPTSGVPLYGMPPVFNSQIRQEVGVSEKAARVLKSGVFRPNMVSYATLCRSRPRG